MNFRGIEIIQLPILEDVKFGFWHESAAKVYVSPSVYKLLKSDLKLMKKNLKILKMPRKKDGADRYNTVDAWIRDFKKQGAEKK